jgi:hypothetical protein
MVIFGMFSSPSTSANSALRLPKTRSNPQPRQVIEDRSGLVRQAAIALKSVGAFDTSLDKCRGCTTLESSHHLSSVSAFV